MSGFAYILSDIVTLGMLKGEKKKQNIKALFGYVWRRVFWGNER